MLSTRHCCLTLITGWCTCIMQFFAAVLAFIVKKMDALITSVRWIFPHWANLLVHFASQEITAICMHLCLFITPFVLPPTVIPVHSNSFPFLFISILFGPIFSFLLTHISFFCLFPSAPFFPILCLLQGKFAVVWSKPGTAASCIIFVDFHEARLTLTLDYFSVVATTTVGRVTSANSSVGTWVCWSHSLANWDSCPTPAKSEAIEYLQVGPTEIRYSITWTIFVYI